MKKNATNTIRVVDSEQLDRLPIRGAANAVSLQAGVVATRKLSINNEGFGIDDNPQLNVRGGRGNETVFIVDGVIQNDILFGTQSGQISDNAIEQVSMQLGGFDAKFGQAQSGVVNITTKRGQAHYALGAEVISSEGTDDYGYNVVNFSLSGPIIPGQSKHTFFALIERNYFNDGNPSAIRLQIPSANIDQPGLPENESDLWRWSAKTVHNFGNFQFNFSTSGSMRDARIFVHDYAKINAEHNPRIEDDNFGYSGRLSHTLSSSTFWNLTGNIRLIKEAQGDGVHFRNLEAYGDTLFNPDLLRLGLGQGERPGFERDVGVFREKGRQWSRFRNYELLSRGLNLDLTSQLGKHLIEFGAGYTKTRVNYQVIFPIRLAVGIRDNPDTEANEADVNDDGVVDEADREARYLSRSVGNDFWGRTPTGEKDNDNAPKPEEGYVFLQDKIELGDLVLNLGLRWDYFNAKWEKIRERENPFGLFGDTQDFDDEDFVPTESEYFLSPRIGLGFPVSDNTVFHAQYGRFIQKPRLFDLYFSRNEIDDLLVDDNFIVNMGDIESEKTIQYEAGFRKIVGDNVALDITAFYKDVKGLVDITRVKFKRGAEQKIYRAPTNTDFGTIKGFAFKFDLRRTNYIAAGVDYTFSIAEGTGSSQSSSDVAAFRNDDGATPKAIAPLDFDQRHTLTGNIDFRLPKGVGGIFERTGANLLITYHSGRPYTPVELQNPLVGASNFGDTKGFVNSRSGPSNFSLDLKIDRIFNVGTFRFAPYLWVINVTDEDNAVEVFRSNGDEFTSGWLQTAEGQAAMRGSPNPEAFAQDVKALERNPANFSLPRQIRLGMKVNFR